MWLKSVFHRWQSLSKCKRKEEKYCLTLRRIHQSFSDSSLINCLSSCLHRMYSRNKMIQQITQLTLQKVISHIFQALQVKSLQHAMNILFVCSPFLHSHTMWLLDAPLSHSTYRVIPLTHNSKLETRLLLQKKYSSHMSPKLPFDNRTLQTISIHHIYLSLHCLKI